jgi:hypothetical protein
MLLIYYAEIRGKVSKTDIISGVVGLMSPPVTCSGRPICFCIRHFHLKQYYLFTLGTKAGIEACQYR